jgi:hypothetical protein
MSVGNPPTTRINAPPVASARDGTSVATEIGGRYRNVNPPAAVLLSLSSVSAYASESATSAARCTCGDSHATERAEMRVAQTRCVPKTHHTASDSTGAPVESTTRVPPASGPLQTDTDVMPAAGDTSSWPGAERDSPEAARIATA